MTPTNPTKLRALADFVANGTEHGSPEADRVYLTTEFGLSPDQAQRVQRLAAHLLTAGIIQDAPLFSRLKIILEN